MLRYIFALILLSTTLQITEAQGSFSIHLDKPFYASGEIIWYKLHLPASLEKDIAVKGILVSPNATVPNRFFHQAKAGQAMVEGYLKLPFNFNSGVYRLEFLANIDPFKPEMSLVSIDIPIYNDFQIKSLAEKLDQTTAVTASDSSTDPILGDLEIKIELEKSTYNRREKVVANISLTDKEGSPIPGNFSVAATDARLVYDAFPGSPAFAQGKRFSQTELNTITGKVYVKGQVTDTLNQALKANVLGSYASLQKRIHYGKTNEQGVFTMELPDFYGEQTLQFIGYLKENEEIRVRIFPEVKAGEQPQRTLPINRAIIRYLEASQQKKQMAEYFENLKPEIEVAKYDNEFEGLNADFSYVADDYVKFETIGSFFEELITPLKFRIVKGIYTARMENPAARDASFSNLPGKPLFIIDGKVTRNADFIARTNWANVKSIDIFYVSEKLRRQFNVMGSGGVVRINTDIPQSNLPANDIEDVFTISGLQAPGAFSVPELSISSEIRTPNFFLPSFWSPGVETNKQGQAAISFPQGDERSTFIISVFAQGKDGRFGFASKRYEVK